MQRLPITLALLGAAGATQAANLPAFEVGCGDDLKVRAEAGGPVYFNDKQATLSKFSEQYYEARGEGLIVPIGLDAAGTPSVSYTGKQGASGACRPDEGAEQEPVPTEQ
ncbi:hypothetical protein AAFN46_07755 [Pseudomonas sp. CAU 1711]|uniref:hypothetical protein n=1 Tax=Pseudomonas sp. CAU 1711 TaxID=3140356 RepID=UPI003261BBA8